MKRKRTIQLNVTKNVLEYIGTFLDVVSLVELRRSARGFTFLVPTWTEKQLDAQIKSAKKLYYSKIGIRIQDSFFKNFEYKIALYQFKSPLEFIYCVLFLTRVDCYKDIRDIDAYNPPFASYPVSLPKIGQRSALAVYYEAI